METRSRITVELMGRGDYIQPSIRSINFQNTLPALPFNDLLGDRSPFQALKNECLEFRIELPSRQRRVPAALKEQEPHSRELPHFLHCRPWCFDRTQIRRSPKGRFAEDPFDPRFTQRGELSARFPDILPCDGPGHHDEGDARTAESESQRKRQKTRCVKSECQDNGNAAEHDLRKEESSQEISGCEPDHRIRVFDRKCIGHSASIPVRWGYRTIEFTGRGRCHSGSGEKVS